jgi:hypothetical protein
MKRQDLISILITFSVGIAAGMYFYLAEVASIVTDYSTPTEEDVDNALTIVGEVYGGCRSTCPSFRVDEEGAYRYLFTPSAGQEQVIQEGELPSGLKLRLRQVLNQATLQAQAKEIQPAVCNSYTDGIDVRYVIVFGGTEYELDSCGTAVDADSELWKSLQAIWEYYEGR